MNEILIYFEKAGNTIVGNYTAYSHLDKAMARKSVFVPFGHSVMGTKEDIARLTDYVGLFGHCIKTLAAFKKAVELAGCTIANEGTI